jgi:uncharacterized protein
MTPLLAKFRTFRYLRNLLLFTLALIYILWTIGLASYGALVSIHPAQRPIGKTTPADWGLTYEAITFAGFDGARLAGWYISPQAGTPATGTIVILLHGYAGTRLSTAVYAKMLARHGYSILMFDQRATGESEGKTLTWGWLDARDLAGAVDFLLTRPETEPQRIGVLGCSTGAEVAITGAALDRRIAAVVADAPFYATASDVAPVTLENILGMPMYFLFIQLMRWRSGASPAISVSEAVKRLSPRPLLLISSGQDFEFHQAEYFISQAGEPKEHWNIPEARHCGGPRARPQEYEARITEFFARLSGQ